MTICGNMADTVARVDFDAISAACVANLAPGGVLVWVVADQIVDGGENGTSFRQALAFKRLGLTLHQTQTLFAEHWSLSGMRRNAYYRDIEYMFALSKGPPPRYCKPVG